MRTPPSSVRLALALTLAAAGCDMQPGIPDAPLPLEDAGPSDRVAPVVIETSPEDGASNVDRAPEVVIRFSEPMAPDRGEITVNPGGMRRRAGDPGAEWDAAGNALTLTFELPLPSGEVTLTLGTDFEDRSGNALAETTFGFTTVDDVAPTVTLSAPTEGAVDESARIASIVVTFSEPMRTGTGTIDVLGGAATLTDATWSADATTVTFPVVDLEYDRDYQVVLRGFRDASGNALDGVPYLVDGVIDFSTGPDADAPRVVRSEPMEGQVDVNPSDMTSILVTFDELMDTDVTDVTLSDGTTDVTLTGVWVSPLLFRVSVGGLLTFGRNYALDLRGMQDRAGNALDGAMYLVDGRLDFTVGADAFAPFVRASSPAEGEIDVSYAELEAVELTFSEAMNTTATTVPVTVGGGAASPAPLTWASSTSATVALTGILRAGAVHTIDVTGLTDTGGNAIDAAHRYLGDGRLDFTTGAPVGEGCTDPLTIAQATVEGPVYRWTVGSLDASIRDGGTAACDSNGTTGNGNDLLIRFDKTSGTVAEGGSLLRVVLDGSTSTTTGTNSFDLAVASGATCSATASPLQCRSNTAWHEMTFDLPAGPVWIWVSRTITSTTAVSAVVSVTEIAPPNREGESCDAPYTTASAIHTMPTATVHRFSVPPNSMLGADMPGPTTYTVPNAFSCDATLGQGVDAVIAFDKPDDASVLRIRAARVGTSGDTLNIGVYDACDAVATATEELACRTAVTSTVTADFLVDQPAGPVYVWAADTTPTVSRSSSAWVYNPGFDVDIEVIPDVGNGEICSRALAASAGMNPVSGTSDQAFERPSCFGATSNVEWYRVTTTSDVTFVSANAAGGLAMMVPSTRRELTCVADGAARSLTRVLPVGTELCVAVEMGRGITSLDITGQAYGGLGSTPPVELGILRPFTTTASAEESVTSDYWMLTSGEHLVMRHTTSAVMDVSRAGMERAVRRGADDGIPSSTPLGRTAVAVGGAVFSFSTTTTAASSRVTRIWDGRSLFWSSTAWDPGSTYVTSAIQAAAPDGADGMIYVTDNATTASFYRLSAAAPSAATLLGQNTTVASVRGMVVDDEYVYLQGVVGGLRGIYRLSRSNLSGAPLALAVSTAFSTSTTQATAMALDSLTNPANLYVRDASGEVQAIIDPDGASPFYLGPVIDLGTSSDFAMTLAPDTGALYLFETETVSTGNWVRYDP